MTRRYSAYKDSGVEWIGEIPEHWEVRKLKYISTVRVSSVDKHLFDDELPVTLCNYTDVYKNDFITSAKLESVGTCTAEEFRKFEITKADVLITKDSETPDDIGVPAIVSEELENTVCGYHVAILRPSPDLILGSFLFRQLQTKYARNYFEINSFGITRFGLGKSATEALFVIKPPIYEQSQIVEFLDAKTSLIDRLIDVRQRRIELLKEKRAALINNAVTKGLDPNVEMKDSGIEWIGEIPEHWKIVPIKFNLLKKKGAIKTGPFGSQLKSDDLVDEGVKVYNQRTVYDQDYFAGDSYISQQKYAELTEFKVFEGDILITTRGTIGKCSIVPANIVPGVLHPCLIRIQIDEQFLLKNYLTIIINESDLFSTAVKYESNATTIDVIYSDTIKNLKLPIPTLDEQVQISAYLDKETKKINDLVTLEQKKIDLLKEYRQALISETVTGKIKVGKETGG